MRTALEVLLEALHADPLDQTAWLALADALEEDGQPERAELTRLLHARGPYRRRAEAEPRVQELLLGGVPPCLPEWSNSIGMCFVLIPPGTFRMGSPDEERHYCDEEPAHEVEISRAFYLGVHPVTQEQWQEVMGSNPSHFSGKGGGKQEVRGLDTCAFPVESVSWEDTAVFLNELSGRAEERSTGRTYRLPSEAEWEYACRAGANAHTFHGGELLSSFQANFNGNDPYGGAKEGPFLERTCKVGSYAPNAWGLYDMHGNVWEWCADWHARDYYRKGARRDPSGAARGTERVIRGGSWCDSGQECRSASRFRKPAGFRINSLGFRVALDVSVQ
jgi:uncharacterized protein (TIGR02996 family)